MPSPTEGNLGLDPAAMEAAAEKEKDLLPPPDFTPAGQEIRRRFAEKLGEFLYVFGAPRLVKWSAVQNLRAWVGDSSDDSLVFARIKSFCESFTASLLGTPHQAVALFGAFRRWIRARCRRVNQHSVELCQGLFRLKAVVGYSTPRMVSQSILKHSESMRLSVGQDKDFRVLQEAIQPVLDHLMARLRSKFEKPILRDPARNTGSTQSSRAVGGKSGFLNRSYLGFTTTKTDLVMMTWPKVWDEHMEARICFPTDAYVPPRDPPVGVYAQSGFPYFKRPRFGVAHEVRGEDPGIICFDPYATEAHPVLEPTGWSHEVRPDHGPACYAWTAFVASQALDEVRDRTADDLRVSVVSEAGGKVRLPTAGTAAGATIATHWQQELYAEMRGLGCFPSLARKFCATDLEGIAEEMAPGMTVQSSDYRGATDNLSFSFTNWMLDQLTEDHPWKEIIMNDNGPKTLHYPPTPWVPDHSFPGTVLKDGLGRRYALEMDSPPKHMKRWKTGRILLNGAEYRVYLCSPRARKTVGQLLGQATSFPLLCLANLAVSLAYSHRVWPDLPWKHAVKRIAINGDDRVALAMEGTNSLFWELGGRIGFAESTGKSHVHDRYACFNSQGYLLSQGRWVRTRELNSGLLWGVKKLDGDSFNPCSVVTALFETVPYRSEARTVKLFLTKWGSLIKHLTQGRNLFLPVSLGGLGQVAPLSWEYEITDYQLAVAARLRELQPHADYVVGPPRSGTEHLRPKPVSLPWDVATSLVENREFFDPADFEMQQFQNRFSMKEVRKAATRKELVLYECSLCRRPGSPGSRCCGSVLSRCREPYEIRREVCVYGCDLTWRGWDDECMPGVPHRFEDRKIDETCGCGTCRFPHCRLVLVRAPEIISKTWLRDAAVTRPNLEVEPLVDSVVSVRWDENPEYTRELLYRHAAMVPLPLPTSDTTETL